MYKRKHKKCTPKELECVRLYRSILEPEFGNKTKAYAKVYDPDGKLSKSTVQSTASRFFSKPHVMETSTHIHDEVIAGITAESIKEGIAKVTKDATQSRDKLRGLELLGKTEALFVDKKEIAVNLEGLLLSDEEDDEE